MKAPPPSGPRPCAVPRALPGDRLRILFLVSSLQGGGAERIATLLCNGWAGQGHAVTLVPTFSGRGQVVYPLDDGVELEFLADHVGGRRGRLRRILALRRLIRDRAPDVVVSFLTDVNVAALLAAAGTGRPVVASERSYPGRRLGAAIRLLRRLLYRRAAAVIAQTGDSAAWLERHCPGSRVRVIANPAPAPAPDPDAAPLEARRLILSLGRLIDSKRNDVLLRAFARIAPRFPDWQLALVGDGPDRAALAEEARALGLADRVALPGHSAVPGEWYSRAGIYVTASSYEGMPNTLIEAMAHGLPSVAFDVLTGPRDVTGDGTLAVLLPDDDHEVRLAEALAGLIGDPGRRRELGARAAGIRDRLSPGRVFAAWDGVLREAAGAGPGRRGRG